ncbi:MAG: hypothetical protein K2L34_03580 [Muribaculaceae bacterium]|nr:hypothetical protein [Muribaculaceae bacterium]
MLVKFSSIVVIVFTCRVAPIYGKYLKQLAEMAHIQQLDSTKSGASKAFTIWLGIEIDRKGITLYLKKQIFKLKFFQKGEFN